MRLDPPLAGGAAVALFVLLVAGAGRPRPRREAPSGPVRPRAVGTGASDASAWQQASRWAVRRGVPARRTQGISAARVVAPASFATLGWLIGRAPGTVIGIVVWAGRRTWVRRRDDQRRRRAIARTLPEAIELLVLVVRAGRVPAAAVVDVAAQMRPPLAAAFEAVTDRLRAGQRFADAIAALPEHAGPIAQPVASALATADRSGLPLAPMLESLADEARRQRRRNAEADARQLPVRLSLPLVLCTLPAFVLVAIVPSLIRALSSLQAAG